jgi:hypothetical protein
MSTDPGWNEAVERHRFAIHQMDTIGHHVGDVKLRSVRSDPNILRHAPRRKCETSNGFMPRQVELDQAVRELAGENRVCAGKKSA